jgi:hypothetical protein
VVILLGCNDHNIKVSLSVIEEEACRLNANAVVRHISATHMLRLTAAHVLGLGLETDKTTDVPLGYRLPFFKLESIIRHAVEQETSPALWLSSLTRSELFLSSDVVVITDVSYNKEVEWIKANLASTVIESVLASAAQRHRRAYYVDERNVDRVIEHDFFTDYSFLLKQALDHMHVLSHLDTAPLSGSSGMSPTTNSKQ